MTDQLIAEAATSTKHIHIKNDIHALTGIRTRGTGNHTAAELRFKPHAKEIHYVFLIKCVSAVR